MLDQPELLGVLETAYTIGDDDQAWLQRVADEVERATDNELGCSAHFFDASDLSNLQLSPTLGSPRAPRIDIARMFATARPDAGEAEPFYSSGLADTGSGRVGRAQWAQIIESVKSVWPEGVKDVVAVQALDARRHGCALYLSLPRMRRLRRDERQRLARLGAHLASAFRMRRAQGEAHEVADLRGGVEAVLEPGGQLLDARDSAAQPSARADLREMARKLDKARGPLRREDPDLALETWTALVSGRWTLLDHFDTDGRRFLVARKNPPDLMAPIALDPRERMVASAVALGHPQKLVCYELGLTPVTVSRTLRSALGKLGLRSAAELASVLGAFVPE